MPVDSTHAEYELARDRWRTVRDACAGQEAIKKGAERYLPGFIPPDAKRYSIYLQLAYYVNVVGRTKNGLIGAVFSKDPDYNLPAQLDYLEHNSDGMGNSLKQLGRMVVSDIMEVDRIGLLADYPQATEGLSAEQVRNLDLKATIKPYRTESIINWDTKVLNGKQMLTMVVLLESTVVQIDEFRKENKDQYRVLILNDDGVYEQRVYNDQHVIESLIIPRKADGSTWSYIPFVFACSSTNSPTPGIAPLYDLANINIAHYRNVADTEHSLRTFSQVMLHIDTGDTPVTMFNDSNPNGIVFGATNGIITQKGRVDLIQASPHNFGTEAVKDKQDQMVSVGAKLITKGGQTETAEAARINASSEHSVLDTVVSNASEAIEQALEYCGEFMGGAFDDIRFSLNRRYFETKLDAQDIMALIQLADRGDIGQVDVRDALRKSGQLAETRTDEEIDSENGAIV